MNKMLENMSFSVWTGCWPKWSIEFGTWVTIGTPRAKRRRQRAVVNCRLWKWEIPTNLANSHKTCKSAWKFSPANKYLHFLLILQSLPLASAARATCQRCQWRGTRRCRTRSRCRWWPAWRRTPPPRSTLLATSTPPGWISIVIVRVKGFGNDESTSG